jgi:transposase
MSSIYYVGLDVHKKVIAFCVKTSGGKVIQQGMVKADRKALKLWLAGLPKAWVGGMEATLFTGWIYDFLKPHARELKVAHPEMVKAITAAKKKNDLSDAERLADLLRADLFPECYMAPPEYRDLRRVLRYRNLVVRTAVAMKNRISGLLMEVGATYDKGRLHGQRYFDHLLENLEDVPQSVIDLLVLSRSSLAVFQGAQKRLLAALRDDLLIKERVGLLMSIPGVGEVTALTWVLEIGEPYRFRSVRRAISYCGLCSAQKQSAGKDQRGPISKKRNKHLQAVLIEAAKLAPRWNSQLAEIHDRELARGNRNRATLAVARKLVAFLLAVDRRQTVFLPVSREVSIV